MNLRRYDIKNSFALGLHSLRSFRPSGGRPPQRKENGARRESEEHGRRWMFVWTCPGYRYQRARCPLAQGRREEWSGRGRRKRRARMRKEKGADAKGERRLTGKALATATNGQDARWPRGEEKKGARTPYARCSRNRPARDPVNCPFEKVRTPFTRTCSMPEEKT